MRRFSASASASTMVGLLGLGGRLQGGAALGLDPLGFGQRGLGHRAVLHLLHGGLGLALALVSAADRPRPRAPELRLRRDDVGLRLRSRRRWPWRSPRPPRRASSCSASLTGASRSKAAVCSPTCCSLSSSATRTACSRWRLAHADLALLLGVRRPATYALALRLSDADLAQLLLLGHVAARLLDRLRRRLLADRLDVAARRHRCR
jgi:hypothetical protein